MFFSTNDFLKFNLKAQFEEEKIWNSLTAMMKGSEVHANFHINVPDGHCVQLSTVRSGKMFELLNPETKQLLSGRWKRLYDLLENLKELASGEFLLVETEDEKLEIVEETNDESSAKWTRGKIEEISLIKNESKLMHIPIQFESVFNGLLYHVPLQWHLVKSRIPVSFLPFNPNNPLKSVVFKDKGQKRNFRGKGRGRGRGRGNPRNNKNPRPAEYIDHDANPLEIG